MKLSYPVWARGTQEAIMAWCGNPKEGITYLGENGYTGIELLVRNPECVEKEEIQEILNRSHMKVSAIGTTPMQKEDHLFLLSEDKEIREEALKRLKGLINLAGWFGAPLLVGKYRGEVKDTDFCRMSDLEEIIHIADKLAEENGTELLIEPQSPGNINNLNTVKETVEWVQRNEFKNVRLLMDLFHMDKTEKNIKDTLVKYRNYIGMIHMADSERKVPGFGKIEMQSILEILDVIDYQGYLSMEIKQIPDTRFAAALSAMSLQYMHGGKR